MSSTRTRKIIQELIDSENKYIETLSRGIKDYLVPYDTNELPSGVAGKRFEIFSNIEVIHEIHEKLFLRKLLDCRFDPLAVANVFLEMVENKYFDNYIVYVQFRINPDEIIRQNIEYFETLRKDTLGILSFLSQPIQRLPRYQLLLAELITDLMNDLDNNKEAITGCCLAEKNIQRLLKVVDTHC